MTKIRTLGLTLAVVAVLATGLSGPAQAANKEFEGNILAPFPAASEGEYAELACPAGGPADPAGGPLNGVTYAFVDFEGDYTKFQMSGPTRLFEDPAGLGIGDYDLDLYLFDAKCKNITAHTNGPEAFVKTDTKKPARYALIIYWTGVHPNQPWGLAVSN